MGDKFPKTYPFNLKRVHFSKLRISSLPSILLRTAVQKQSTARPWRRRSNPRKITHGEKRVRVIPIHDELRVALEAYMAAWPERVGPGRPVVFSERGRYGANGVTHWFKRIYRDAGLFGASSHSGRRTLLTNLARHCAQAGASLRDVQRIAGHADLGTTERYVEPSLEAQRRLIALT